jgi:flagellar hook-associated protein 1 FlgK
MSLASAINTAQTIFSNTGLQSSALAQNIANASNPDYSRRVGTLSIDYDNGLVKQTMYSTADSEAQSTLQDKLQNIQSLLGGNNFATSPSTYIATLRDNLQAYATKPNESTLASTVVSSAIDVANSLNQISSSIQTMRAEIDQEIDHTITELEGYLKQFGDANSAIKAGTALGKDVNNELDVREGLLKKISEIVGIRSFTRADNDMVLYTSDGTMLFDSGPREIMFVPNASYDAGINGNPLIIDGQAMSIGANGNTTAKGSLQALLQVRDSVIPTYQTQLDETSRGLIEMFAQKDQAGLLDDIPGLFSYQTYAAGDTLPATGTLVKGLSAEIMVNPNLIKSLGGDPTLLRDGGYDVNGLGIASADYLANTDGDAGFSTLLDGIVASFQEDRDFDDATLLDTRASIGDFATSSVGWLSQLISESAAANETKAAQLSRVSEALSNTTGVSIDEELSLMLDLEQSYKASSKLVAAADEMIQSLLSIVR